MSELPKYIVLDKKVGETPLQCVEKYRSLRQDLKQVPLAYAGRLDPMASGKLLVLVGEECKKQTEYHSLDKEYEFEVLFGTESDTADVLGLIDWKKMEVVDAARLRRAAQSLTGSLTLPYPKFSSKTVKGKPLHLWTLENRLDEIEIPEASTNVYSLKLLELKSVPALKVFEDALEKINSIPTVTEESKALGRDFRRDEVRISWQVWFENHKGKEVQIAKFICTASSGTYMRSLAEEISRQVGTVGLAYSIHRSTVGTYRSLPFGFGFWSKKFD